jgi:sRNA-binding carbon storage regulator CsrA
MLTIVVKEGAAFCIGLDVTIRFVRDSRKRLWVQIAAPKDRKISRLGFITSENMYEVQNGRSDSLRAFA